MHAYDESDLHPPERHARIVILTSGTTGTPKGAPRKEAGIDAAVSLLSRMPLRSGDGARTSRRRSSTPGASPPLAAMLLGSTVVLRRTLRPGGRAARRRGPAVRVAGRDPGDAAADPGPRREVLARYPSTRCEVVAVVGVRAAGHAGPGLDGPLRRQPLQHLRLDRGRLRLHRTPEDLRADADLGRQPPYGTVVQLLDEAGSERPRGRHGAHLRRQRPALRGLHRRRDARSRSTG